MKQGDTRSTKSISWSAGSHYECSSRWLFYALTCQGQAAIKILGWPRWALIAYTLFLAHCHMIYGFFSYYYTLWSDQWPDSPLLVKIPRFYGGLDMSPGQRYEDCGSQALLKRRKPTIQVIIWLNMVLVWSTPRSTFTSCKLIKCKLLF